MRKGHAIQKACIQPSVELCLGELGKQYGEGLKGTGEVSGKEKRTIENRKECIYYIKIKHFSLLKVTKDSQLGVTDSEGKMTRRSTMVTVPMERSSISYRQDKK